MANQVLRYQQMKGNLPQGFAQLFEPGQVVSIENETAGEIVRVTIDDAAPNAAETADEIMGSAGYMRI